ncbi:GNAT family N-acetyltransferase [Aquimarina macrocephali]|uniref:GNAT family N-acetyltransferase n=1 Tax=Aquimarina macrocephali TaxID=666563 RepID=UPI0004653FB5|nr:GNAT family N-acetyltransferase [Aquimarina macrocephali]
MKTIDIRRATIEDAEKISSLGRKTFDESYGEFFNNKNNLISYLDWAFSIEKIKNSLTKPENLYWLVTDTYNSLPIGYAKLKLDSPSELIDEENICKLQRIYLLQGYEARGIGGKLHQYIVQAAVDSKHNYLWLSNLKLKKQAVAFYKKKGYQIAGEHNFTIGDETFEFWAMKTKLK